MAEVKSRGHRQSVFIDALRGLPSELVIPFDPNVKSIHLAVHQPPVSHSLSGPAGTDSSQVVRISLNHRRSHADKQQSHR